MTDRNIVNPDGSSYSLAQPGSVSNSNIPFMDLQRTLPRQVSTGLSRGVQQIGGPNIFVDSGASQIIVSKDTVNNVLMGNQPNFGPGFYVSKPGVDITKASLPEDLIFNSNQNIFKIVKTEVAKAPDAVIGSPSTNTYLAFETSRFPHNLGYTPATIGYVLDGARYYALPYTVVSSIVTGGIAVSTFTISADQTNTYITNNYVAYSPGASVTGINSGSNIKYYLLQESASFT